MSNVSDLRRSAARSLLWSIVQTWGSRAVSMIVFFCLARLLTPGEFGLASSAILVFGVAALVSELGIGDALIQQRSLPPSSFDAPFALSMVMSVIVAGLVVVFAQDIAILVDVPGLSPFIVSAALLVPFSVASSFQEAIMKREMRFGTLAIRALVSGLAGGLVGVAVALGGHGAWALVAQFAVQILVGMVWLWTRPVWRPGLDLSFEPLRRIGRFGLNLVGMRLVDFAAMRTVDVIVLTHLGPVVFGLFAVSTRLYLFLMQLFQASISSIGLSVLSRVTEDRERLGRIFIRTFSLSTMFGTPIFFLLSALASSVSDLMFGAQWAGADRIMVPFLIVGGVHCTLFSAGSFLTALGRADVLLRLMILKAALVLLPIVLIRPETPTGMAYLIAFGLLMEAPFTIAATLGRLGLSWSSLLRPVGAPFLCAAAAAIAANRAVASLSAERAALAELAAGSAVFAIAYLALTLVLARRALAENKSYILGSFGRLSRS